MNISLSQGKLTPNALEILKRRYILKDKEGNPKETPEGLFHRVASAVVSREGKSHRDEWEDIFFKMMWDLDFLPNSPCLMNAGTGQGTLSACYVLPLEDTMESIMKAATDQAMIEKFGGGVGFPLSNLRPKSTPISTTQGYACGPVAVLRVLSEVGTMITQGGKRDGAHMAIMEVYHPDIEEFISCKTEEGKIHNFNISVAADSNFMKAVENDESIHLTWPICKEAHPEGHHTECEANKNKQNGQYVDARIIFNQIVEGAWKNGEPGMVWLDRINEDNTTPSLGTIQATNPCGEQPLLGNESCTLGSINLGNFTTTLDGVEHVFFDEPRFLETVRNAVRFLDDVVSINTHPTEATAEFNQQTRKIGLGLMGWADLLIKLRIPYASVVAINLSDRIGHIFETESDKASEQLGRERGSFDAFIESTLFVGNGGEWEFMRNAWRRSIAPTGTISMIADCSSGIEPIFALAYKKHNMSAAMEGVELFYMNNDFLRAIESTGDINLNDVRALLNSGDDVKVLLKDIDLNIFSTSSEISVSSHVDMQAVWQPYIDSGISKTINLPNSATEKDIYNTYLLAWSRRCKGITVYREGSRAKEVLVSSASKKVESKTIQPFIRPEMLHGITPKVVTGHGNAYITINFDDDNIPREVIATIGKGGDHENANIEAISRLISLAYRYDIPTEEIVDQLENLSCCPVWYKGQLIKSPADGIAKVLKQNILGITTKSSLPKLDTEVPKVYTNGNNPPLCPDCQAPLTLLEGCQSCRECGYSRCG